VVDVFLQHACELLETAESAARHRETLSETTVLVRADGGIHMVVGSDWSLESLTRHHGAVAGYRVRESQGTVELEGRAGYRECRLKSAGMETIRRQLLALR
jgi:hypothetical protein